MEKKLLEDLGIDVDEALTRFLNNETLLMKFVLKFPGDPNFAQLKDALAAKDLETAYVAAHTLKGVAGNLSMTALFGTLSSMVDALRGKDLEKAVAQLPLLEAQHSAMVNGIQALQ